MYCVERDMSVAVKYGVVDRWYTILTLETCVCCTCSENRLFVPCVLKSIIKIKRHI
jgi:hypothetical protein